MDDDVVSLARSVALEQVEHGVGRGHGMQRQHVAASRACVEHGVKCRDLQRGARVSTVREVQPDLGHVAHRGGELGRVARVRLVAAAVREPPGVQAHAHAHVVRACELALGTLELAGRHRGAQRAHVCRRELARRGRGVVIEREVRVKVKDARLASGVGWRRPRRHRSPLSQRHGS